MSVDPLNFIMNASNSQCDHKISASVLFKSDKMSLKIKLGVMLYVVNIHPV